MPGYFRLPPSAFILWGSVALALACPALATQPDVYANPVTSLLVVQTSDDAGRQVQSPGIEGDRPGPNTSGATSPYPAGSAESSATARPDTPGSARRNMRGDAPPDTRR